MRKTFSLALASAALVASLSACSSTGALGDVLGGVLNSPSNTFDGTINSVDSRSQTVYVQQSNGQVVGLAYDSRTQVVYQNQNYPVTSLENGDRVNVRFVDNGNSYYADVITVTQSVTTGNDGVNSGTVYSLSGTARSIDRDAGTFRLDMNNGTSVLVVLPYNLSSTDVTRFRNLRSGDYVSIRGVYTGTNQVSLREFN